MLGVLYGNFQYETELLDDSLALPGFPSFPSKIGSSEEEFVDSDDVANSFPNIQPTVGQNQSLVDSKVVMVPGGSLRRELRGRGGRQQHAPPPQQGWFHKMVWYTHCPSFVTKIRFPLCL